jgi:hypothetical protein
MNHSHIANLCLSAGFLALGITCLTSCSDESTSPSASETVVVTKTATTAPTPSEDADAEPETSDDGVGEGTSGSDEDNFVMPNEVGKTLQAAQDDLQARSGNPFFYSDSKDATAADRLQALDSGWQVCSQNKKPGTKISIDDQSIIFMVVRVQENCP